MRKVWEILYDLEPSALAELIKVERRLVRAGSEVVAILSITTRAYYDQVTSGVPVLVLILN
ncbi:MAG: hypothetical protein M1294_04185 [Firmicutes bacterium]|jgi:aspartate/glutamate racemase|uniref:Uncharacterized protein n=1 Tax=Sulfobacillus benefaciens TaxID=453960 RepID=A0A2T2X4I7_9FIRM|nr:hypothetical protein [Bacillota bacterium]MCL5013725.1 hypothetical protein [Bacillota bacterium]PSR29399.1 MAG: hypothetical protein C7B43_08655 [Sulfobacillus benefaciens]